MHDLTLVGLMLNKLGNPSIYFIWSIQASNFCLEPYLKCFGTSQLELEMLEIYKNKVNFT